MSVEKYRPGSLQHEIKPFTTLPNHILQGCTNAEALAVWCLFQSLPTDWGICVKYVQNHFGLGRDKVRRIFDDLIRMNLLEYHKMQGDDGKFVQPIYKILNGDNFINIGSPRPENQSTVSISPRPGLPAPANQSHTKETTHTKETKTLKLSSPHAQNFDRFWEVYPRKIDKRDAIKAWEKLKGVEIDMVVADIKNRLANDVQWQDKQYIPYPSTYLRGERWNDEIITAEPKVKVTMNHLGKPGEVRSTVPWYNPDHATVPETANSQGVTGNDQGVGSGNKPRIGDMPADQATVLHQPTLGRSGAPGSTRSNGVQKAGDLIFPRRANG